MLNRSNVDNMELGNLLFGHSRGKFDIPRDEWEEEFRDFLHRSGFDGYGHAEAERLRRFVKVIPASDGSDIFFENDTFIIRPYYWGDDEEIMLKPNFVFKPKGINIDWYKYPLRDAYISDDIDFDAFVEMIKTCENSLRTEEEK